MVSRRIEDEKSTTIYFIKVWHIDADCYVRVDADGRWSYTPDRRLAWRGQGREAVDLLDKIHGDRHSLIRNRRLVRLKGTTLDGFGF